MNWKFWQKKLQIWVVKDFTTDICNKIVCVGEPVRGSSDRLVGPFQTEKDAEEYADRMNMGTTPLYSQLAPSVSDDALERVYQAAKSYIEAYRKGNLTMGAVFFGQLEKHVETVTAEREKKLPSGSVCFGGVR